MLTVPGREGEPGSGPNWPTGRISVTGETRMSTRFLKAHCFPDATNTEDISCLLGHLPLLAKGTRFLNHMKKDRDEGHGISFRPVDWFSFTHAGFL